MRRQLRYALWVIIFAAALLFSNTVVPRVLVSEARAHDWYPKECCSTGDCDPVESIETRPLKRLPGGSPAIADLQTMTVTTKRGTVEVPANMRRRESKDHRAHACIRTSDGMTQYGDAPALPPVGTPYLVCIFFPPPM